MNMRYGTVRVRGLSAIFFLLLLSTLGFAQTEIICRTIPGANPVAIAQQYHIQFRDRSGPFVLFESPVTGDTDTEGNLGCDARVLSVSEDEAVPFADTQSKGGTIGAVGDRTALYALNKDFLSQIHFSEAMAMSPGRRVVVAVLDTGVSPKQPRLWKNVVAQVNFVEPGQHAWDLPHHTDSTGNGIVDEATGHGTMVAGIIDQIAPKTSFVIARVADSDGIATAWRLVKGIVFAVANHAEVANISLGAQSEIPALEDAVSWADQNNLLVVAPIGNNDQRAALYPSRLDPVVCVSGVDPKNLKASFSNWDSHAAAAAPATGIKSTWWDGTLAVWSGTSFASPFVAGAIADCLRRRKPIAPSFVREVVKPSGIDISKLNPSYEGALGTLLNIGELNLAIRQLSTLNSSDGP